MPTCIFCRSEFDTAPPEHVFAEPLGHVFTVQSVCAACNHRFVHEFDHRADRDAIVSFARHRLGLPIRPESVKTAVDLDTGLAAVVDRAGRLEIRTTKEAGALLVGEGVIKKQLLQMLRASLSATLSEAEILAVRDTVAARWDSANPGDVIDERVGSLTISITKEELVSGTTLTFHDEPEAINRTVFKIAVEFAAEALGSNLILRADYDGPRAFVSTGAAQPTAVEILRTPALDGSDLAKEHVVRLDAVNGLLEAQITLFGSYVLKIQLGPAPRSVQLPRQQSFLITG